MDDRFLHDARREPRPEFAARLEADLKRQGPARPALARRFAGGRPAPLMAAAAAAVLLVLLFTVPSVRAYAQAFLDLFRVRNFAAVPVDPARLKQLDSGSIDIKSLLGNRVETLRESGPPQLYSDPRAAGAAAGIAVRLPVMLPRGLKQDSVFVRPEGAARLTVDLARVRQVTHELGIEDAAIPSGLDGARVSLRMPAAVAVLYRAEGLRVGFVQAHSPEVSMPAGTDLARVGELGLRILGMAPAEAHRFAQTIDWHSTMLVPAPTNVSSFREVQVQGSKGLLITTTGEAQGSGRHMRPGTLLMWGSGDMVYALHGNIGELGLTEMANSLP